MNIKRQYGVVELVSSTYPSRREEVGRGNNHVDSNLIRLFNNNRSA